MSKIPTVNFLPALQKGDLVDLVSPGSSSTIEDVERCRELLQSWGLKVRLPKSIFAKHAFHSNEDKKRLLHLKTALLADDSRAIWCLRGGYGSNRLVPELCKMKKPRQAKMLIGYSDITTLHLWLSQKWGWPSYHGPLLESLISGRLSADQIEECRQVVFGEKQKLQFQLKALNSAARKINKIQAPLMGGNLVVIESAIATQIHPELKGKILFLEEVGERGYRVDRMLEHLKQSQVFRSVKTVIFGDFLGGDERDGKNFVQFAIDRFAKENSIACFQGLETGHGEQNRILPLSVLAQLEKTQSGAILTIATGLEMKTKLKLRRKLELPSKDRTKKKRA